MCCAQLVINVRYNVYSSFFLTWISGISCNFALVLWTLAGIFCITIMQGLMNAGEYVIM
jgi:hypothetical protein